MLFSVLRRGDAPFFFEYLAKIRRGIEAAFQGNPGHVAAACLHHFAGLVDLDGIEIGHQRNTQVFPKKPTQMILGYKKVFRDLPNIRNAVVIFVDILYDSCDAFVGVGMRHIGIGAVCHSEKDLVQIAADLQLILRLLLPLCSAVLCQHFR